VQLENDQISVSINSLGAEIASLASGGHEYLWQAGPVWPRHAPILFPTVGRMPGDQLVHDGIAYPIGQHGFARDSEFVVDNAAPTAATFSLRDSPETRTHYPFAFELKVTYSIEGSTLNEHFTVTNPSTEAFSASLGGHPAFAWPLAPGIPRDAHVITFSNDEPAPIHKLTNGLLQPTSTPTPVRERVLALNDALFEEDALVFDSIVSRTVRYTAPGAASVTVRFDDFEQLGVWSKLPGEFVCIEPWFGTTAPADFAGEYSQKPRQFRLEGGAARQLSYSITIEDA
jgi:galactose mutarotase-like enzyme